VRLDRENQSTDVAGRVAPRITEGNEATATILEIANDADLLSNGLRDIQPNVLGARERSM
jgi:hypothetical protein